MIIGHEKITAFFEEAAATGNLGHAYCFSGNDEVGKRTLANAVAAKLLKVTEEKLLGHPDYVYIERVEDEKTGKLKKDLSVRQARELRGRLQNRAWLGGYQAVVVNEAELLNEEGGNALLKILEEPAKQSVIFLLTTDETALLPTIRSRCQHFYFSLVSEKAIEEGLTRMGYDGITAKECARLSWGRPGRAILLAQDGAKRSEYYSELYRLQKIVSAPFGEKLQAVEELFGKKDDDVLRKRDRWQRVLEIWQMVWRDALVAKYGAKKISDDWRALSALPSPKIVAVTDALRRARKLMGENINPRLLIEEILLKF